MKKISFLFIAVLTASVFGCSQFSGEWAAKVDGEKITLDEFNSLYYTQNKIMFNLQTNDQVDKMAEQAGMMNPQVQQMLNKNSFLDQMIAQKLIYTKALNDDSIDQKELKTLVEFTKMQTVASYYLGQKLKDQVTVNEQEIEKFYNENRQYFRGVPLNNEVVERIRQQILMQKSKMLSNEYVMNLVAEAKVDRSGLTKHLKEKNAPEKKDEAKKEDVKTISPENKAPEAKPEAAEKK